MKVQKVCESKVVKFFHEKCSYKEKRRFFKNGITPEKETEWNIRVNFYKDLKAKATFLRENLARAAKRDNPETIEITVDYLLLLGVKQKWMCNIYGVPLEFVRGGQWWQNNWCNPSSCTIDRIDSDKGYIPGNVQLLTWKANCFKQDFSQEELFEFANSFLNRHKQGLI